MKLAKILIITTILFTPFLSRAEEIKITIKNIKTNEGTILIGIYKSDKDFENEAPIKNIKISKKKLLKGVINYVLDLPEGIYGFALLDDKNNNKEMDENFFGIPQEGYGFSNYVHSGMFRPSFDDFKFSVKKGKVTNVVIDVDYF